jgi:glycosyltransferase involved in cell wall biosynthesis
MSARALGVPAVVNTVHGLYTTPEDRLRKRAPVLGLEWAAAHCSHYELFQSAEDLAWAWRLRIVKPDRSAHLGNGIDLTRFDPAQVTEARLAALRAELGIAPGELVVGMVGRLVAEKGYRELFEALEALRSELPGIRALVIGDADPDKPDALTSEEIRRATEAGTIFLGWREDVRDLLALMDVFTLPSWREGLPRSAVEAAAMGRPLVLTDIRGCREVVDHMDQGLLVPPRDPVALASALRRMLTDAQLRGRTGERARSRALESFDEREVARKVVAVYDRLTGPQAALPVADSRRTA